MFPSSGAPSSVVAPRGRHVRRDGVRAEHGEPDLVDRAAARGRGVQSREERLLARENRSARSSGAAVVPRCVEDVHDRRLRLARRRSRPSRSPAPGPARRRRGTPSRPPGCRCDTVSCAPFGRFVESEPANAGTAVSASAPTMTAHRRKRLALAVFLLMRNSPFASGSGRPPQSAATAGYLLRCACLPPTPPSRLSPLTSYCSTSGRPMPPPGEPDRSAGTTEGPASRALRRMRVGSS